MRHITDPAEIDRSGIRRILVIKLRAIGDVLLSTVVIPNLRAAFPDAVIDFLTESAARGVVEGNPHLDEVLVFRPNKDSAFPFFFSLARRRYDLAIDLFCNPRSAQMCFATRARMRVGYPFRGRAWAYNVHVTQRSAEIHNTEFNLDALRRLGIPVVSRNVSMPVGESEHAWAGAWISALDRRGRALVALNPSGTWQTKRWPLEKFAALADRLAEEDGVLPLLVWGPGELPDVEFIRSRMRTQPAILPPSTLKQLAAVLQRCDAMISNDAGPMHIGAATGIPVLGIFGPTNPKMQGPYNALSAWVRNEAVDCLACNLTSCPIGNVCMTGLGTDAVLAAFRAMRERTRE